MAAEVELLTVGVYTVGQASRLTGVAPNRVRGWLRGYPQSKSGPSLGGQLPAEDGRLYLGFLDLMEVRFIDHFLNNKVKWSTIRQAARRAREKKKYPHPFANRRFITDGFDIFEEVFEETGDKNLQSLLDKQYAMYQILENLLLEGIEFDESGLARLWKPSAQEPQVVLDPYRAFGRPILHDYGVPTEALYEAFQVEKNLQRVSEWYEVPAEIVNQAISFEMRFAA